MEEIAKTDPPIPESERLQMVLSHIKGDVLDIGCVRHEAEMESGDNWLHKYLYSYADSVLGLDYLPEEVEKLGDKGYNVETGDAQEFELDMAFDTVVAGELIEHLPNPGMFLDCAHNHLRKDGKFVLSTPNAWCAMNSIQSMTKGPVNANPEHTCWFDETTITQLLERSGFAIDSIQYVQPPPDWASEPTDRWGFRAMAILYRLGLKMLSSPTIVVVARPKKV